MAAKDSTVLFGRKDIVNKMNLVNVKLSKEKGSVENTYYRAWPVKVIKESFDIKHMLQLTSEESERLLNFLADFWLKDFDKKGFKGIVSVFNIDESACEVVMGEDKELILVSRLSYSEG